MYLCKATSSYVLVDASQSPALYTSTGSNFNNMFSAESGTQIMYNTFVLPNRH